MNSSIIQPLRELFNLTFADKRILFFRRKPQFTMQAFTVPVPIGSVHKSVDAAVSTHTAFTASPFSKLNSRRCTHFPVSVRTVRMGASEANSSEPLVVMVNGLPGKMAAATAEQVLTRGLLLADEAMTGEGMEGRLDILGRSVTLRPPDEHAACLQRLRQRHNRIIVVDYTHPSVANRNVDLYTTYGLSFVIGTTGGNVSAMHQSIQDTSDVYAVIAPNMAKQIVAFQAMIDFMAKQFPGAFDGYTLTVKESHQSTKADTSGTAKAVVSSFVDMGLDFSMGQIEKVRDSVRSIEEMNVPEDAISGHAYHTYHLTSPDGTVNFEFQHNVTGRTVYAAGTVDAVQFLDAKIRSSSIDRRVFSMIDVLQSGSMS